MNSVRRSLILLNLQNAGFRKQQTLLRMIYPLLSEFSLVFCEMSVVYSIETFNDSFRISKFGCIQLKLLKTLKVCRYSIKILIDFKKSLKVMGYSIKTF